jgi:NitT/TauT family transport system ATP-binding protein
MHIECDDVNMIYERRGRSDLHALADISFHVERGEFVSLLGPSGCGKSTLLRIIDGLAAPTSGQIRIDGRAVSKPGADRALVFQADSLLPWRTAAENARLGLDLARKNRRQSDAIVARLLEVVGLAGFEDRYPRELSGGMRQRVNLARALAVDPEVLLMDEPFGALDAQTREDMQDELLRICREYRKTILFVTHSIEEAVFLSDRVLLVAPRPGRIASSVTIDLPRPRAAEVRRTPEFAQIAREIWEMTRYEHERAS